MPSRYFVLAKRLHRALIPIIVILTLIMVWTGLMLKYPNLALSLKVDLLTVRFLHSQFSIYFALALIVMMLSGLVMYLFPLLRKKE